ncbi:RNase H family protein [Marisediminicola senii]|uniref:RNase H family protein n=1 Tax=Marisediminicola senii TaxID=2711233 RepID=UPI001F1FAAC9|nr:RNase H family protein [Marisediminicola senii]
MITAAADGSALGNPGPAGWAWYVDDDCWAAGGWKHATNNQGELMAVLDLFRSTAHLDDELLVLCDSQYVINSVTKWMRGWKAKGWRKGDGKPVMNLELLKEIDAALVGRKYRFEWVKGHANHPLNEAADARARAVAEAFQRGRAVPSGPGWVRKGDVDAAARPAALRGGGLPGAAEPAAPAAPATPAAAVPAAAPAAAAHPELFSFDDDGTDEVPAAAASTVSVTVSLSSDQFARLTRRATAAGISPEEALRDLI